MEDTKESTKAKSKTVTSPTKASRQTLSASQNTNVGSLQPTDGKDVTTEAEKLRDLLARMKDLNHSWPCRMPNGEMPIPFISSDFIVFAMPIHGHVIKNAVTSEGGQNFEVDGLLVIPDVREEK